jgi:hypothetical protein
MEKGGNKSTDSNKGVLPGKLISTFKKLSAYLEPEDYGIHSLEPVRYNLRGANLAMSSFMKLNTFHGFATFIT